MKDSFVHIFNGSVTLNNDHKQSCGRLGFAVLVLLSFIIPFFTQAQHLDNRKRLDSFQRARTASASSILKTLANSYNVTGGGAYCSGGSGVVVGLDGSQQDTVYQLQLDGINIGAPVTGNDDPISFGLQTAAGTYTVVANTSDGTISMNGQATVTINPLPTPTAGSNSPQCVSSTLNLNANGGVSYTWTGPNGFTSSAQNPSITNVTTGASGIYTVIVSDGNSCSATTTTNVTINALPTPTAGSNTPVCAGSTLNLTATGGTSYSWTGPNGFTSSAQNPSITNVTTGASGLYTVTVTDGNGCSATTTTNVTINALPTPTAGSNTPVCAGSTLNFTATGGTSYSWTGPNGFTSSAQNPSITNVTTGASGLYTVTVTDGNGCSATTTTNATINALPTPTAGSNTPVCAGSTLNFTATGGTSYSWTGPNGFTSSAQNPSITNVTTGASGIYTVIVSDGNSCSATTTTNVTINALPTPTAGSNTPVCAGSTLNLTATGGTSYSWTGPNGFTSSAQNPSITNVTTGASGLYTVTVTDGNGCSATTTTNVTINALPTPTAGSNTPVCAGSTLNFTATGGTSYSWTGPNGFTSNIQNPSINNVTTGASGLYTVTVTDGNGCSATTTTNVTINALPTPTAGSNTPVCAGSTLNFTATGGTSYSWTGPNGFTSSAQNPSITNVTTGASGLYTVTVTDGNGCSATTTTNVTINALPTPTAGSNTPVCAGSTLNLTATGGTSYSWTGPNGFTSSAQNPSITNVTTGASGLYTVTVTDGNGCSATTTTNVTINALPTPTAGSNTPQCAGATLNLTATGGSTYAWTGPNGFTSSAQNPSITNVTTGASDLYTVTVTDGNGCSATTTTNVTINALPTPTAGSNTPQCAGSTLNLTATGGSAYAWTGPNGFTSSAQNPSITNVTTGASGLYTVTVTDGNGCSATATTNVTINALPTPTAGSNTPVCAGSTLNLTATGGTSYSWTGPNGFTSSAQNPSITNVTTGASGIYTVIVSDGNSCSATTTTNVTINALPTPTAGSNTPVCAGSTLNLTATGGTSYSWTGPNGFTSSAQNPSITNVTTGASGLYTVTVTDGNGCSATTTTNVTINALPTPTAGSNTPVCAGSTLNFTATGGTSYSWTGPNGFTSNIQNPSINNVTTGASGLYTVTVTDGNGCSATTTTNVTINALPTPTAGSNTPVCAGSTLNFTATGGTSYSWTGPNGFTSSAQNPSITNVTTGASGLYTVTVTDGNGCSATTTTNVTINALPTPTAGSNTPVCAGSTLNLTATGGTSYSWTGPNGFTSSAQNPSITNVTTGASGLYTVTVTDGNGCSATTTTNVTINALPTPTAGSNTPVCAGSTLNLTATGGTSYSWTGPNGFTSNIQNPSINNVTTGASGLYTVTVTDGNGCSATTTTNVTINALPTPTAGSNTPQCAGSTLNLTATGGSTYAWTGPNGFTSSAQNPSITNVTTGASGLYTVTVTDGNGCSATATTNVTINALPTPTAGSNTPQCAGSTLNLTATGGSAYAWTGPNGFTSNIQNPTITNATTGASGSYTVTVTDANGCIATATTNVTINPFPTANAVSNQTYCNSIIAPVTPISGSVPGTTFNWTNSNPAIGLAASGSGDIPSFTATNTTNAPITATITITPSASGCTGTPITYTITVNPTPTVTAVSNQTHCSSASVTANSLSGPVAGTTFTWTNSNTAIGLAASGTGNIPSFTATNTTTAPITATITITPTANGCTGTPSTYTVTVNPLPAVNAVSNAVYCNTAAGAAINFASNVPGATFAWTSSANVGFGTSGTGNIDAFTASNSTNAPVVATISVTATANGCTGAATTFTITVNPIPAITATPATQTVCSGTPINTITISNPGNVAGTTYAWTRDNTGVLTGLTSGTGSTISGTLTNTTNTAQSTIFTITSSANGCTSTTTATVIVNPRPAITNQTATICSGGTFTVTPVNGGSIVPAGTTYTWGVPTGTGITGGAAGSGSSITGTLTNTGTAVRTATYTVTPVSGSCTGSTFTVTVTLNPVPAIANQNPSPVCSGSAFTVTPSGTPTGTTYTWGAPTVTGGITGGVAGSGSSITGTLANTTGAVQTATYTVTPVTNGCAGNTFTVTATINPATIITTAPVNITVCEGGSATFSVAATGLNLTYQWQIRVNGNNYNNIAGATSATYTKSPVTESNENRYRVIITGTCGTANPTAELTVNPLPTCSITGTNTVCPGISTTFTASGGGTYSWTGPNGFTAGTQTVSISDSGTYTVTVTNNNGCKTSCTRTLAFNPTPTITVTPASAAICSGTSTTLTASGATSFSWNPGTSLSSTVNATVVASPTTTTTYSVTGYNASGCYGSATVTVTVTPEVVGGTLSPAVTNYCEGAANSGTLTLSGYTGPIVRWEASNDGGASWSTIVNTGNTLNYSNLTQTTLYRAFLEDGPCSAYSGTAVVTITPLVPPTGVTASPSEICLGDSTTLTATASGYPPGWNTVQAFNSANLDQNEGWSATNNGAPHNIQASADNEVTTPWNLTNPHTFNGIPYDNPDGDKFAIAAGAINTSIISAAFNTIGLSSATFNFQQAFNLGPGAVITVEISTDSGLTWHTEPLMKYTGPLNLGNPNKGWVTTSIDLSNYLGLENLKIRWNYQGTAGSNWAIDNAGIVPPPLPLIYNWTLTDPAGVPSPYYLNSTTGPTVNGSPTSPGTYVYTVSTTYGGCAGGSMNVPVVVKPLPICNITGNNAVCPGSTNTYSAPAIDGYTYTWTISGGATISGSATGQTVTVVANNTCGIYTLTLVTSLNGCSSSTPCTLVVNVVDNTAPVATAPATQTFQCLADVPAPGTLTATDNCSGDITATGVDVQVAKACGYTITRTWTFTDACNNTSSVSQIINVADDIPPVITCPPAQVFCVINSNTYTIPPATASDNCSGAVNITYQITGATTRSGTGDDASGVFNVGVSTITWTATDVCGNISTCTSTVTINPKPAPIIYHN